MADESKSESAFVTMLRARAALNYFHMLARDMNSSSIKDETIALKSATLKRVKENSREAEKLQEKSRFSSLLTQLDFKNILQTSPVRIAGVENKSEIRFPATIYDARTLNESEVFESGGGLDELTERSIENERNLFVQFIKKLLEDRFPTYFAHWSEQGLLEGAAKALTRVFPLRLGIRRDLIACEYVALSAPDAVISMAKENLLGVKAMLDELIKIAVMMVQFVDFKGEETQEIESRRNEFVNEYFKGESVDRRVGIERFKGVMVDHRNLLRFLVSLDEKLSNFVPPFELPANRQPMLRFLNDVNHDPAMRTLASILRLRRDEKYTLTQLLAEAKKLLVLLQRKTYIFIEESGHTKSTPTNGMVISMPPNDLVGESENLNEEWVKWLTGKGASEAEINRCTQICKDSKTNIGGLDGVFDCAIMCGDSADACMKEKFELAQSSARALGGKDQHKIHEHNVSELTRQILSHPDHVTESAHSCRDRGSTISKALCQWRAKNACGATGKGCNVEKAMLDEVLCNLENKNYYERFNFEGPIPSDPAELKAMEKEMFLKKMMEVKEREETCSMAIQGCSGGTHACIDALASKEDMDKLSPEIRTKCKQQMSFLHDKYKKDDSSRTTLGILKALKDSESFPQDLWGEFLYNLENSSFQKLQSEIKGAPAGNIAASAKAIEFKGIEYLNKVQHFIGNKGEDERRKKERTSLEMNTQLMVSLVDMCVDTLGKVTTVALFKSIFTGLLSFIKGGLLLDQHTIRTHTTASLVDQSILMELGRKFGSENLETIDITKLCANALASIMVDIGIKKGRVEEYGKVVREINRGQRKTGSLFFDEPTFLASWFDAVYEEDDDVVFNCVKTMYTSIDVNSSEMERFKLEYATLKSLNETVGETDTKSASTLLYCVYVNIQRMRDLQQKWMAICKTPSGYLCTLFLIEKARRRLTDSDAMGQIHTELRELATGIFNKNKASFLTLFDTQLRVDAQAQVIGLSEFQAMGMTNERATRAYKTCVRDTIDQLISEGVQKEQEATVAVPGATPPGTGIMKGLMDSWRKSSNWGVAKLTGAVLATAVTGGAAAAATTGGAAAVTGVLGGGATALTVAGIYHGSKKLATKLGQGEVTFANLLKRIKLYPPQEVEIKNLVVTWYNSWRKPTQMFDEHRLEDDKIALLQTDFWHMGVADIMHSLQLGQSLTHVPDWDGEYDPNIADGQELAQGDDEADIYEKRHAVKRFKGLYRFHMHKMIPVVGKGVVEYVWEDAVKLTSPEEQKLLDHVILLAHIFMNHSEEALNKTPGVAKKGFAFRSSTSRNTQLMQGVLIEYRSSKRESAFAELDTAKFTKNVQLDGHSNTDKNLQVWRLLYRVSVIFRFVYSQRVKMVQHIPEPKKIIQCYHLAEILAMRAYIEGGDDSLLLPKGKELRDVFRELNVKTGDVSPGLTYEHHDKRGWKFYDLFSKYQKFGLTNLIPIK